MSPGITNGILASIRHRDKLYYQKKQNFDLWCELPYFTVESKDVQPCIKPGYTEKLKRLLSKHVQEI